MMQRVTEKNDAIEMVNPLIFQDPPLTLPPPPPPPPTKGSQITNNTLRTKSRCFLPSFISAICLVFKNTLVLVEE